MTDKKDMATEGDTADRPSRVQPSWAEGRIRSTVGGSTGDTSEQVKGKAQEIKGRPNRPWGKPRSAWIRTPGWMANRRGSGRSEEAKERRGSKEVREEGCHL